MPNGNPSLRKPVGTASAAVSSKFAKFVYVPDRVTIAFSRAMEGNTLADSLMIEPRPENFGMDVKTNMATLHGFFEPRTHYQITIPATAVDKQYGIGLDRDYTWSFTVAK